MSEQAIAPGGALLSSDEVHLLASVGFLASGVGLAGYAADIFNALALLRSDSTFPHVGNSIALMNARRPEEAAHYLQAEALQKFPDDVELQSFLALALRLAGESGRSEALLRQIVDSANKARATAPLAQALLATPSR